MRVLITGATGLIGKEALEPLIDSGFEVYATTSGGLPENNLVNWVNANLLDKLDIKRVFEEVKPEFLLHFAWVASGDYLTSDVNYDWLDSSVEMLSEFKLNGGRRAVFAGTCFEYEFDCKSQSLPLKEDGKLNPTYVYSKCKNELRQKAELYCADNDVSFGWGRIFYVYGIGENSKRLTPYVIKSLKDDIEVVINSSQLVKDYMYTKEIARAFVEFLASDVSGVVNICTGTGISLGEYCTNIAQKLKKEYLLQLSVKPSQEPSFIIGCNKRLNKEIGFKVKYTLGDGIDEILQVL